MAEDGSEDWWLEFQFDRGRRWWRGERKVVPDLAEEAICACRGAVGRRCAGITEDRVEDAAVEGKGGAGGAGEGGKGAEEAAEAVGDGARGGAVREERAEGV